MTISAGVYPGFRSSMKQLRLFLLPKNGILVNCRVNIPSPPSPPPPKQYFSRPLYNPKWGETTGNSAIGLMRSQRLITSNKAQQEIKFLGKRLKAGGRLSDAYQNRHT